MHLWLQQGLRYWYWLQSLVFPRRPFGAATVPMMGKRALRTIYFRGHAEGPFWTLQSAPPCEGRQSRLGTVPSNEFSVLIALMQILIAIRWVTCLAFLWW